MATCKVAAVSWQYQLAGKKRKREKSVGGDQLAAGAESGKQRVKAWPRIDADRRGLKHADVCALAH